MSGTRIRFSAAPVDQGAGRVLLTEMHQEIERRLDGVDFDAQGMPQAGAVEFGPPAGVFLVGVDDDEPVCCGGIKRLDDTACEIKRMYVRPGVRGQGVARQLLAALEEWARRLGYSLVRLDTNSRLPRAQDLFRATGYVEIANFNDDPVADYFAEKTLSR